MFGRSKLIRMYLPVLMESASNILLGIITSIMLSGLGEHVITATSMVGTVVAIASTFISGVTTGAIVKVSQYIGAKDMEACKKTARQAIIASVAVACIATVLLLAFGGDIIKWLFGDADSKIIGAANLYFNIYIFSLPLFALFSVSNGIMYGTGDFKRTMKNSLLVNAGHILISAFFIYVLKLGVAGAGLSYILCRGLCGTYVYRGLRNGTHFIQVESALTTPDFKTIWGVLKIGLPSAFDGLIITGSNLTVQTYLVALGSTAMAAHAMISSMANFILIAGNAVASMSVTVVGQCYGSGDMKMCRKYMLYLVLTGVALSVFSAGIAGVFSDSLLRLYNPSVETFELAKRVFGIILVMYSFLWAPAFITPACLRGCGDVKYSATVSIMSLTVVKLPIAWFSTTQMDMGLAGIWFSVAAEWITRIIFIIPRALSRKWEKTE